MKREFQFCKTSGNNFSTGISSVSCHMNNNDSLFHHFRTFKKPFPLMCIMNILIFKLFFVNVSEYSALETSVALNFFLGLEMLLPAPSLIVCIEENAELLINYK